MNRRTLLLLPAALLVAGGAILYVSTVTAPLPATTPSSELSPETKSADRVASPSSETKSPGTVPNAGGQVIHESPPRPEPEPPAGVARVTLGEREIAPKNRVAHFERIKVTAQQEIPIEVAWPEDKTSTEVLCHAIAGGKIDNGGNALRLPIKQGEPVKFTFKTDHEAGLYQVVLRRGIQEEVMEFWVPTTHPENDPPAMN